MRGITLVASAKTICSLAVSTFPHELASFNVEELHAPSLTSATVICIAYFLGKIFNKENNKDEKRIK